MCGSVKEERPRRARRRRHTAAEMAKSSMPRSGGARRRELRWGKITAHATLVEIPSRDEHPLRGYVASLPIPIDAHITREITLDGAKAHPVLMAEDLGLAILQMDRARTLWPRRCRCSKRRPACGGRKLPGKTWYHHTGDARVECSLAPVPENPHYLIAIEKIDQKDASHTGNVVTIDSSSADGGTPSPAALSPHRRVGSRRWRRRGGGPLWHSAGPPARARVERARRRRGGTCYASGWRFVATEPRLAHNPVQTQCPSATVALAASASAAMQPRFRSASGRWARAMTMGWCARAKTSRACAVGGARGTRRSHWDPQSSTVATSARPTIAAARRQWHQRRASLPRVLCGVCSNRQSQCNICLGSVAPTIRLTAIYYSRMAALRQYEDAR